MDFVCIKVNRITCKGTITKCPVKTKHSKKQAEHHDIQGYTEMFFN